ncbi:MAG: HD-GYP domain-containing protein [Thiohalophilus sp.]|uniref:HD-GYP domain-containing protein n=1 Tax=Thiohalophilus sp. TaxID=3028392 RepID=UPI00286FFABA|nr:HD-GYP domain-containing protein [Thiohalophilus sp.]MDR9435374.1 HD-GYP domain-containing protein [Thiohalophilus sp.]
MKIRIETKDLRIGMYVSEIDRPWIESPFLFQGFPLSSQDDIEQVQSICEYVYIDTEKMPRKLQEQLRSPSLKKNGKARKARANKTPNFTDTITLKSSELEQSEFKKELLKAREVRDQTRSYIDSIIEEVRMGKSINTKAAKRLVAELADSIARNPDASMWLTNLKNRDEYTAIHSVNVCVLSITFGRALGLGRKELDDLGLGALLHDLGKIKTPLEILNKPGRLTDDEYEVMKAHPVVGYELLYKDKNMTRDALDIVLSHHERIGGNGYPNGLEHKSIKYYTRIVAITDVYDAITSDRVYRDGMTPHEALKKMYNWAPGNFDEDLMQFFIRTIGIYPVGSVVEFVTGHVGVVVKQNADKRLKPVVMLLMNRNKEYYPKRKLINLGSELWEGNQRIPEISRIIDPKEFDIDVKAIIKDESQTET